MLPTNPTIEELGITILYLPIVIIISLVVLGMVLFVTIQIIGLFIRIPVALFHRSFEEKKENGQMVGAKQETTEIKVINTKELWFQFKGGNWIVWVALLPIIIYLLYVTLYFLTRFFAPRLKDTSEVYENLYGLHLGGVPSAALRASPAEHHPR